MRTVPSSPGSSVPSGPGPQALTLLNDPFVLEQAQVWAGRIESTQSETDPSTTITAMYDAALGRPPSASEQAAALDFWNEVKSEEGTLNAWSELAHVLFNVKEFVAIP